MVLRRSRMPRISVRSGWNFTSSCCIAAMTRAIPFFSSLNADESMMAIFAGVAAGRVCVCARIVNAAKATAATAMQNTFIAFCSLIVCVPSGSLLTLVLQSEFTTLLDAQHVNRHLRVAVCIESYLSSYAGEVFGLCERVSDGGTFR